MRALPALRVTVAVLLLGYAYDGVSQVFGAKVIAGTGL